MHLTWLPGPSLPALRRVVDALVPTGGVTLRWLGAPTVTGDPVWWRGTAVIDGRWVVKSCWSEPAARELAREIEVHRVLADLDGLRVPAVTASTVDPVVLVTPWRSGTLLETAVRSAHGEGLATALAAVLATFHAPSTLAHAVELVPGFPAPRPQADARTLRERFPPGVGPTWSDQVYAWCDWIDAALTPPAPAALVHGDLHGSNVLVDEASHLHVLDLGEVSVGDHHYDFRYLPALGGSVDLFADVVAAYTSTTGRAVAVDRVLAWHILTVLGDALWRTSAGVALPDGRRVDDWLDDLAARLLALGIDID